MRFAYADPPYPGKSRRWYGQHPDYAGEVDHAELVACLVRDYPDGWALSTSTAAVRSILMLCPDDVRLAVWHSSSSRHPGARADRWWNMWEPVIVCGGRRLQAEAPAVQDHLSCGRPAGTLTGQKPEAFCWWVFDMLGAQSGDEMADLFPGSGAVSKAWNRYHSQGRLMTFAAPVVLNDGPAERRLLERYGQTSFPG